MKSLLASATLLSTLLVCSQAQAGEVVVGVGAGVFRTAPLEVIGTSFTVVPKVGYYFNDDVGLELDVGIAPGKTRFGAENFPYLALTPRLNLVGRLWNREMKNGKMPPVQPLLSGGIGLIHRSVNDDDKLGPDYDRNDLDFLVAGGPGVMVPIAGPLHLRTDLRWLLAIGGGNFQNRGDQFVNWEWTAGVGVSFGGKADKDNDGILDRDDSCVDEPEDMDGWEDEDGCPDTDNDGDGLKDFEDKECPNEAEDKDGLADDDGCPEDDADEDGVLDEEDQCPTDAGTAETQGCPDTDGDGVSDLDDECLDEKGSKRARGCYDEDDDRVPDYRDACPTEKADKRVNVLYSNGCPTRVVVAEKAIVINEKVFFDTGKATIKPASHDLLKEVADTLKAYPNIKKVDVEGHTDNTGDPDFNLQLSKDRAASVVTYLTEEHGIDAERFESHGYGQTKPREGASNDTDEGRAQNRRVEFKIVEFDKAARPIYKRAALEMEDTEFTTEALVVTKARIPKETNLQRDQTCKVEVEIDAEGKVRDDHVTGCMLMARSVTRRAMLAWEFEPIKVGDAPTPHTAVFTWTFKDGKPTVTLDGKSVKPIEE